MNNFVVVSFHCVFTNKPMNKINTRLHSFQTHFKGTSYSKQVRGHNAIFKVIFKSTNSLKTYLLSNYGHEFPGGGTLDPLVDISQYRANPKENTSYS